LGRLTADGGVFFPGSEFFAASELAQVTLAVGGLTIDDASSVKASMEIVLFDENNRSLDILIPPLTWSEMRHRNDVNRTWNCHVRLPLPQPGNYRLAVIVHDLNSGEVDGYILPIVVKASIPAQRITSAEDLSVLRRNEAQ